MKKDFFVGADISKDKLDICFLTSNETKKPLKFLVKSQPVKLLKFVCKTLALRNSCGSFKIYEKIKKSRLINCGFIYKSNQARVIK